MLANLRILLHHCAGTVWTPTEIVTLSDFLPHHVQVTCPKPTQRLRPFSLTAWRR